MERYKATIEYDGTGFSGFQVQKTPGVITVQGRLQKVLSGIFLSPVKVYGAGRTDSGVHATGQVIHFDVPRPMEPGKLARALNGLLRGQVSVSSLERVSDDFHARFDAVGRHYIYLMDNSPCPRALLKNRVWHYPLPLDLDRIRSAADHLVGRHDFSLFCKGLAEIDNPVRTIFRAEVLNGGGITGDSSLPVKLPLGMDRPGTLIFYFFWPFIFAQSGASDGGKPGAGGRK